MRGLLYNGLVLSDTQQRRDADCGPKSMYYQSRSLRVSLVIKEKCSSQSMTM